MAFNDGHLSTLSIDIHHTIHSCREDKQVIFSSKAKFDICCGSELMKQDDLMTLSELVGCAVVEHWQLKPGTFRYFHLKMLLKGGKILILFCLIRYHIAGIFRGRKLSRIGGKPDFCGDNFHRLLTGAPNLPLKMPRPQISRRKPFPNSHKTSKFMKVFSLKSFPL